MRHWHTIAEDLADLIIQETGETLQDAMSKIDDALFDLYGQGGAHATRHMAAMQNLRFIKADLLADWPIQVRDYCKNFGSAPVTIGELTLVTDSEMEANLAATTMGESLQKAQRPLFNALEIQFERLFEAAKQGEWEGIRENASTSDAPLHPLGLAHLLCNWLLAWDCEGESRIVGIKQLERRMVALLPKLLPSGLAVMEKYLGVANSAPSATSSYGSPGNPGASNTSRGGDAAMRGDVLPMMDTGQGGERPWLDTLNEQDNFHSSQPVNDLRGQNFGAVGNWIEQQGQRGHGALNEPLYLDDLIKARQDPHIPSFMDEDMLPMSDGPINMGLPLEPQDNRGIANALFGLMGRLGSMWPGGQGGGGPTGPAPMRYTGRKGYDPTLDFAQIDESELDPAMADLLDLIQKRRSGIKYHDIEGKRITLPRIGPQPLGDALKALQAKPSESIIDAARKAGVAGKGSGGELTKALKESLVSHSRAMGAPEDGELEESDSDAADVVGMLFEIFLSERQISEDMRSRIAHLVAPYVRVAVADRKMFMQKTHPARRYLDTLVAAIDGNQGANHQERQMLDKAGTSINHLTESFNEDLAIFELAEEEMRLVIDQRKEAIEIAERRAADAQRGKERLDQAKNLANESFENAIEECNWPVKTLEMIRGWWCQHHRMALLQDNPQVAVSESEQLLSLLVSVGNQGVVSIGTQAVRAHNSIIQMLSSSGLTGQAAQNGAAELWSALEQASIWTRLAAQGQLSSDDLARTSTKASREAERAALSSSPQAASFQDLSPEIDDVPEVQAARKHEAPKLNLSLGRVEEETQEDLNDDELPVPDYFSNTQDIINYFKTMAMGTWIDFVTPDRKVIATKLSWISPISNRLLFVTARGTKHAVESPEDLAVMVKLDRVRLRRAGLGENGFESSYRKAINVLSKQADSGETPEV